MWQTQGALNKNSFWHACSQLVRTRPDSGLNFNSTHLFGWFNINTFVRIPTAIRTNPSNPTGLNPMRFQACPSGQPFCSHLGNPPFQATLATHPSKSPFKPLKTADSPLNPPTFPNHSVTALTLTSLPQGKLKIHLSSPPFEPTLRTRSLNLFQTTLETSKQSFRLLSQKFLSTVGLHMGSKTINDKES